MKVVITEAGSSVAYHLLYLLGNGDILGNKKLHLILCDREEERQVLEGVSYELQDCIFKNVASIRVSCNFCDDFKTADLVIMLPSKISHHTGQAEVKVTHSLLQERDFRCLEGAIHTSGRRKDVVSVSARGPMSKAVAIGNHIREAYQDSIQVVKFSRQDDVNLPILSSVSIYGAPGPCLYDELILPKIYPETVSKLMSAHSDSVASDQDVKNTKSGEQLFERLSNTDQADQVLLVYALEQELESDIFDTKDKAVKMDLYPLLSRL